MGDVIYLLYYSRKLVIMNKNEIIKLNIVSVTSEGFGVAKNNEFVFFVPYAIEGEEVNARILKVKKNIVYCRLVEVITPSPARITPECEIFHKCGGCSYLNINYEKQLEYKLKKINDALMRIGKLDICADGIIPSPVLRNYRNKALIPVASDKDGNIVCGFFRNRTHDVIDMNGCLIQDKDAFKVTECIKKWMNEFNIQPYDEKTHTGMIRHVFFRKGIHTGEIMAGIVSYKENIPHLEELKQILIDSVCNISSIIVNINNKNTNVILGDKVNVIYGKEYISDKILNLTFNIGSKSFFQVNPYNVENLYSKAISLMELNENDIVFDIYCGIGTIGLCTAEKVKEVIGVEVIPEATRYADENAKLNGFTNAKFYTGKAEDVIYKMIEENNRPTAVFLDPPRAGCEKSLIEEIIKLKPEKICYVSCDVATLARDLKIFEDSGLYKVKSVTGCDMFPETYHVETVALLQQLSLPDGK